MERERLHILYRAGEFLLFAIAKLNPNRTVMMTTAKMIVSLIHLGNQYQTPIGSSCPTFYSLVDWILNKKKKVCMSKCL